MEKVGNNHKKAYEKKKQLKVKKNNIIKVS